MVGSIIGGLIQAGVRVDEHPIGVSTYRNVSRVLYSSIATTTQDRFTAFLFRMNRWLIMQECPVTTLFSNQWYNFLDAIPWRVL